MSTGKVKWFKSDKGYGFITVEGDRGPQAANVTVVE